MTANPLSSLKAYSEFIANILDRPSVLRSNVAIWSDSPYTGIAEDEVYFINSFRLRIREELDFLDELIASYDYEVYQESEKLYWYDDFPHPNDLTLASTMPQHKHVPPNIKRNRIPAPNISFVQPNLPVLIAEIEGQIKH